MCEMCCCCSCIAIESHDDCYFLGHLLRVTCWLVESTKILSDEFALVIDFMVKCEVPCSALVMAFLLCSKSWSMILAVNC